MKRLALLAVAAALVLPATAAAERPAVGPGSGPPIVLAGQPPPACSTFFAPVVGPTGDFFLNSCWAHQAGVHAVWPIPFDPGP